MNPKKGLVIATALLAGCIAINVYSFKKATSLPANPAQITVLDTSVEQISLIRDSGESIDAAIDLLLYLPDAATEFNPQKARTVLADSIEKLLSASDKPNGFYFDSSLQDVIKEIAEIRDSLPDVLVLTEYDGKPVDNKTFQNQRYALKECINKLNIINDANAQKFSEYVENITKPYAFLTLFSSFGVAMSIGVFSNYLTKISSQMKEGDILYKMYKSNKQQYKTNK